MNRFVIHPYYFSKLKRIFDVVAATGLILSLSPLWLLISLLIWITAGWPIFFCQTRSGQNGRKFQLLKFRTMRIDAAQLQKKFANQNEAPWPMFKLHRDPRFVGMGRWFSNTGLDELPQLWNIWRGEMSLVGPRPLPIAESQALFQNHPDWNWRLAVRPGIFSEWSLDSKRHQSLAHWQELEKLTLTQGGLIYEKKLLLLNLGKILIWTLRTSLNSGQKT